jgi:beta-glucosidase
MATVISWSIFNSMQIRPASIAGAAALFLTAVALHAQNPLPFQNPDAPLEARITDLLARMTLEEKIDCLGTRPDVPRLGVKGSPHIEGYHGVAQGGPSNWGQRNPTPTTQFPQAYGLGATWDPELVRQVAEEESMEARFLFQSPKYNRAGLVVRAPNADLARDPRWGRTEESFGEDAFHVGTLAAAFVRGLQGTDPRYLRTASLTKHFLANSQEDGRESSSSNFDERLWREYYAKSFEMAAAAGAPAMMAAYNAVNGTPAHVHPHLRAIVMQEWGLDGIICTDGGGLRLLVSDHKAFPDLPSAAAACIKAGINQFLDRQKAPVTEAVQRGLLTETEIDQALRGGFRVMIRLGLLDPPERVPYSGIGRGGPDEIEPWNRPETKALVRTVTQKSIVLLKNSAGLLPLDKTKLKTIAVVGPHANHVLLDWYSGTPPYSVSPRAGIEKAIGRDPTTSVKWVSNMGAAALDVARSCDVVIVCVGNSPESEAGWATVSSPSEGKEGIDRQAIVLQPDQEDFVRRIIAANPRTVVVLIANFPYAMPWAANSATTILQVTHASQELGNALADVIFGVVNPGGKLAQTWPKSLKQLPPMNDFDLRHGRTYMYFKGKPQYPFGYGLSYTTFELDNLKTNAETLDSNGSISVTVDLHNRGSREGDEVVQLYVRFPVSKVERPLKQLRGFQRVTAKAGETKTVSLELRAADLAYWSPERHAWTVEPGPVELLVGNSSSDRALTLSKTITIRPRN